MSDVDFSFFIFSYVCGCALVSGLSAFQHARKPLSCVTSPTWGQSHLNVKLSSSVGVFYNKMRLWACAVREALPGHGHGVWDPLGGGPRGWLGGWVEGLHRSPPASLPVLVVAEAGWGDERDRGRISFCTCAFRLGSPPRLFSFLSWWVQSRSK